jgi:hypothetical protein
MKHFNKEFKGTRLDDLRTSTVLGKTDKIKDLFANGNVDLLWLTENVQHGHSPRNKDKKCLLPDDESNGQPHLEARWIYFLTETNLNVLTNTNHQKIRTAISAVLSDPSYDRIEFDCIECDPQNVFAADEFDDGSGKKYMRIVLGTPPMIKVPLTEPNLEIDPQPGYSNPPPTLVPADGNGDAAKGQQSNTTEGQDPKPKPDQN